MLQVLLSDENLAKAAAHDIDEGLCDTTPVCRAVDLLIQFALEGSWANAAERILLELAKEGVVLDEISGLITNSDVDSEEDAQPLPDDTEAELDPMLASLKSTDESVDEKALIRQQTYTDCVRKIRLEQCRVQMEELKKAAAGVADNDPEKLNLLRELAEWTRRLREVSRKM